MKKLLGSLALFGLIAGLNMPLIGMMGQAGRQALPATRRAMTTVGQRGIGRAGQAGNVTYRWKKPQLALPEPQSSWFGNWGNRIKSAWTPTTPKPPTLGERRAERHLMRQQFPRTPKQFNISSQGEVLRSDLPVSIQRYRAAIRQHPKLATAGLISAAGLGAAAGTLYAKPEKHQLVSSTNIAVQTDPRIEALALEQENNETPEMQAILDMKPKENELFSEVIIDSLGSEQTIEKKPLNWVYRMIRWKSPENSIHTLHKNLFEQEANSLSQMHDVFESNLHELDEQLTKDFFLRKISPEELAEIRGKLLSLATNLKEQATELKRAANSSNFKESVPQERVERIVQLREEFKNLHQALNHLPVPPTTAPIATEAINHINQGWNYIASTNKAELKNIIEEFIPRAHKPIRSIAQTINTPRREPTLEDLQELKQYYDPAHRGLATILEESPSQGMHSLSLV